MAMRNWFGAALLCALALLLPRARQAQAQTAHFSGAVSTVASGFYRPFSVAMDASGDVFVADAGNGVVKEILAGTGGAASGTINASSTVVPVGGFYYPESVAVDASGDVFVTTGSTVKEIIAGTGSTAGAGKVDSNSTVISVGSGFNWPGGVAVDASGNVFVGDSGNNAVKEIVAGTGGAASGKVNSSSTVNPLGSGFNQPYGVAVDASGNVFVADMNNNLVKEIVANTGGAGVGKVNSISTVNPLGSGFNQPSGVAVDASGNVFVADSNNSAVKEIVANTGGAGIGKVNSNSTVNPLGSGFSSPTDVVVDASGNLFVSDYSNNTVTEITFGAVNFGSVNVGVATPPTATLTFYFDTGGTIAAPAVLTQGAAGKDFTDAGTGTCTTNGTSHAYAAGDTCTVVAKFTPMRPGQRMGAVRLTGSGGAVIATEDVYGTGTGPMVTFPSNTTTSTLGGGFSIPYSVALDGNGDVFVADTRNNAVKEIPAGCASSSCVSTLGGGFGEPGGVAVDGAGNVYVADYDHSSVKEIPAGCASSSCVSTLGGGFSSPYGVAVDGAGNVYVADFGNSLVKEMPAGCASSSCVTTLGGGFREPSGVAVDGAGNVFVADFGNNSVKEMPAGCASSSCVSTLGGGFNMPFGVALDGNGDVFVADTLNNAVKEMPAGCASSSCVSTLGGGFSIPYGVVVDSAGNVFVADTGNSAVKEIPLATPPSLSFASTLDGQTSSAQTVTVANSGNADLTFPIPTTGNDPSIADYFTWNSNGGSACPLLTTSSSSSATLASGASCTLPISFAPTTPASGTVNGSLVLTDNNLNATSATQTISLTGTAAAANPTATQAVSSSSLSVNQTTSFTPVTGSGGTAPLTYSVSPALPAGLSFSSTTGAITGQPTAASSTTTYTVTVTDANSLTGTATFQLSVSALAATLGVTAAPASPSTVNTLITFTAQLSGVALTPAHPTGTVTFAVNGSASPDCPDMQVNASGRATCTTNSLHAGSNSITATYSGDINFTVATAGRATQTVNPMDTTTTVGSTPNTSSDWTLDHPVTLTARVVPSPSGTAYVPYSGSVTFTDNAGSITGCSSAVAVNTTTGVATCTAAALIAGSHNIVATYAGDTNYNGSTSSTLPNTVDKAATTTVVASSSTGNHSTVNDSVTFTATVAPNPVPSLANELAISGSVAFYMDGSGTPISGCSSAPSSYSTSTGNATATCTTTSLTAAGSPHAIVARYAGDSNYNSSDNSATPMSQTVSALAATLGVTPSPASPSSVNTSVTFTAQLAGVALTPVTPSGTVAFLVNGSASPDCPAVTVNASGRAACTTSRLAAGLNSVSATYAGDSNFTVATAGTATQTVNALAATLGVTASPSSSTMVNDSVTFTAQLAGVAFTPVVPAGKVNFTANGSTISGCGAVSVNASGRAACTTSSLAAGSDPITATYSGDSNFTVAAAGTMTQTVTATTATTAAMASLNYSPSLQTVSLSATVTSGSGTVNVGTVTFTVFNGGTPVGAAVTSGTVTGGAASATYTLPGGTVVGAYSIQAVYNASAPFATSSDSTHSLTVGKATAAVTLGSLSQTYTGSALAATATTAPTSLTVNFTYNGSSTAPTAAGSYTVVGTISDSNYQGSNTGTLVIGKATAAVTLGSLSQTYTGSALAATATTVPTSLTVNFTYNGSSTAPTAAGSYTVVGTISDSNYQGSNTGTLVIGKATAGVTLGSLSQTYTGSALAATATTAPTSLTVNFTYNGNSTAPTAAGSYTVVGTISDSNYQGSNTGTLVIGKATAGVTLGSLSQTYTGSALAATATTAPTSLTVNFTYNGSSTAPTAAGSYTVVGTISDSNYQGSNTGTLVIGKATAAVTLGSLSQTYTGSALAATATTVPTSLTVNFTYNGSSTAPTAAGSYTVVGTISDSNYQGSNTGTLVIGKATPTITWATPAAIPYGTALNATQLNASSTVAGTYVYSPLAGVVPTAGSQTLSVTLTPTDSTDYTTAASTVQLTVNMIAQTISFTAPSPVTYGTTPIALSATGGASGNAVTFSVVSGPGSIAGNTLTINGAGSVVVAANQLGNTNYTAAAQVAQSIVVNRALPAIAVASSANPVLVQNAVTLTATVSSPSGIPTGTVSFLDGTAPLGPGTLSGGVATLTTSSLAVGTHSITAVYSGDGNFAVATSASLTQTIQDFNLNISASAGSTVSQTVVPGGTAIYTLIVTPTGGAVFPAQVNFTISGLPAGATATFAPPSLAAGSGTTTVTLTVKVPQQTGMLAPGRGPGVEPFGRGLAPIALGILLLPFAGKMRRSGKRLGRLCCLLLLLLASAGAVAGLSGCGSGNGFIGQPQTTSNLTVTATSGALSHTTTLTLTVQ
jgi:hypothetical protein